MSAFFDGRFFNNGGFFDLQQVIGPSVPVSRTAGPQVQRFMFHQPVQVFGGLVADPPGQTAGAVVIANPLVGPLVMRRMARRPYFVSTITTAGVVSATATRLRMLIGIGV